MNRGMNVYHAVLNNGAYGAIGPHSTVINNSTFPPTSRPCSYSTYKQRSDHITGRDQQLEEIPYDIEKQIIEMLDPSGSHDFRELAGYCDMTHLQVSSLVDNGKTSSLLQILCEKRKTVGYLVDKLQKMGRLDVMQVIGLDSDDSDTQITESNPGDQHGHMSPTEIDFSHQNGTPPTSTEETGGFNVSSTPPSTEETGECICAPPPTEQNRDYSNACAPSSTIENYESGSVCTPSSTIENRDAGSVCRLPSTQETGDSKDSKEIADSHFKDIKTTSHSPVSYRVRYDSETSEEKTIMSLKLNSDSDSENEQTISF